MSIDTVVDSKSPLGYWNAATGAVLGSVATYPALTQSGTIATAATMFDGTGGGTGLVCNGTDTYLSESGNTIGNDFMTRFNASASPYTIYDGVGFELTFKTSAAELPTEKTLFQVSNTACSQKIEITFGISNFDNAAAVPWIACEMYNPAGNYHRYWSLAGDGSTYGHLTDGNPHTIRVWFKKVGISGSERVRIWVDGVELTNGVTDDGAALTLTNFATTGMKVYFGTGKKNSSTITRYFAGTIQAPMIFDGLPKQSDILDILRAKLVTPTVIAGAYRLDCDTATFYSTTDNATPAVVGDQVHYGTSADGKLTFSSTIQSGTITAIGTGASPSITCNSHGLVTGQVINITNSTCTPNINGDHRITRTSANAFTVTTGTTVTSSGGNSGTWTCKHGPFLRQDENSNKYLQFPNRYQGSSGWPDAVGNRHYWLDVTPVLSCPQGYFGIYIAGSVTTNRQRFVDSQIATWHNGSEVLATGITVYGNDNRLSGQIGAVIRTPADPTFEVTNCSPGIGFFGLSQGYFGADSAVGSAALYNDGKVTPLSSTLINSSKEYVVSTKLRLGVTNTTDYSETNTTCFGFDGRIYKMEITCRRPITGLEFQAAEKADRILLGLPERYQAVIRCTGDSTWSAEQDVFGDGTLARVTGIRNYKIENASYPGIQHMNFEQYFDIAALKWKRDLPCIWIDGLGINDTTTSTSLTDIKRRLFEIYNGVSQGMCSNFYAIGQLVPSSGGVGGNATYNTWASTGVDSPFDATFTATSALLAANPPTTIDPTQIHGNDYAHQLDAAILTPLIATGLSTIIPSTSSSTTVLFGVGLD